MRRTPRRSFVVQCPSGGAQAQTLRARQPLLGLEVVGLLHRLLRGQHKVSDQSSLDGLDLTSLGSVEVR